MGRLVGQMTKEGVVRSSIVAGLALLAPLVWNTEAQAQFLRFGDIPGESADADHEGWIVVETVTISPSGPSPPGRGASPATGPGTLTVTRLPDSSSPALIEACRRGDPITEAELDVRTESTGAYIAYVLSEVVILECDQATSGQRRIETLTFEYAELGFRPVRQTPRPAPSRSVSPQR